MADFPEPEDDKFIARIELYMEQIELACQDIKRQLVLGEGEVLIEDNFDFIIEAGRKMRTAMERLSLLTEAEKNYRCRVGIF